MVVAVGKSGVLWMEGWSRHPIDNSVSALIKISALVAFTQFLNP